jgi:cold shock CspA family protein
MNDVIGDSYIGKLVTGKVTKWYAHKGYGFVSINELSGPTSAMLHISSIVESAPSSPLHQSVMFVLSRNAKGYVATKCRFESKSQPPSKRARIEAEPAPESSPLGCGSLLDMRDKAQCDSGLEFFSSINIDDGTLPSATSVRAVYMEAMRGFVHTQTESLKDDLDSNCKKGDDGHATKVRDNYSQAAEYLLSPAPLELSMEVLMRTHALVMDGLHPTAGILRTQKHVRVGSRPTMHPSQVLRATEQFIDDVNTHMATLLSLSLVSAQATAQSSLSSTATASPPPPPSAEPCLYSLAGWLTHTILHIHPFEDGNGRTCRLLACWILRRFRVPFPITMCPSPVLRTLYSAACKSDDPRLLCRHIASRVASAWRTYFTGCTEALQQAALTEALLPCASSSSSSSSQQTSTSAPSALILGLPHPIHPAAVPDEGCLICMDNDAAKPSVVTACCSKPFHLTCLHSWTSRQRKQRRPEQPEDAVTVSCPHCRADMAERGVQCAAEEGKEEEQAGAGSLAYLEDSDTESTTSGTWPAEENEDDEDASTTDFDDDDLCRSCNNNKKANGCTNDMCGPCCGAQLRSCLRHDCYTGGETTEVVEQQQQYKGGGDDATTTVFDDDLCRTCNNKKANGCAHDMCGRCCRTQTSECARHDGY